MDLEPVGSQASYEGRREPLILEDAAGEGDRAEARCRPNVATQLAGDGGDCLLEPRRQRRHRRSLCQPLENASKRRPRVVDEQTVLPNDLIRERTGIRNRAGTPLLRQQLQLDRGLRLVLGDVSDAEEARRSIEEAACRRGLGGVEAAGQLDAHDLDFSGVQAIEEGPRQFGVDPFGYRRAFGDGGLLFGRLGGFERLGSHEVPECHAVRLLHRQRPARHGRAAKAADAPVLRQRGHQNLAAPESAVVAHAQAVESHADELRGEARFGRGRRNMRVVMLDGDAPALREVARRVLRRQVSRMQVVDHVGRIHVEQPHEVGQVRLEGAICEQVLEVARVRRHVGPSPASQRERVLELGAHRQNGLGSGDGQMERLRGVASAAPDHALAAVHDPRDGVVVPCPDLAVVGQERIGDA